MFRSLCVGFLLFCKLFAADYDCIVIGTSPFSLLEAYYHSQKGEKVLVVDKDEVIGGVWRTVEVLGVSHAELGCHWIHRNQKVLDFLSNKVGCALEEATIYRYDSHDANTSSLGYYLTHGCFSLIQGLMDLIHTTDIELRLGVKANAVIYDTTSERIGVNIDGKFMETGHVVVTSHSSVSFAIDGRVSMPSTNTYEHIYLLVEDPSDPKFGYMVGFSDIKEITRAMNMTRFIPSMPLNKQLIALQMNPKIPAKHPEAYVSCLIKKGWLAPDATLSDFVTLSFEQGRLPEEDVIPKSKITKLQAVILQRMSEYIDRWEEAF